MIKLAFTLKMKQNVLHTIILSCKMDSRTLLLLATVTACWLISGSNPIDNGDEMQRIVGGQMAKTNQLPFMTGVLEDGRLICSSTIVAPKFVLTAAHCVVQKGIKTEPGVLSLIRNENSEASEIRIKVEEVIPYEEYNETELTNDIAILKLTKELVWSDNVMPIAIPDGTNSRSNRFFQWRSNTCVAGWGNACPIGIPCYMKNLRYAEHETTENCAYSVDPDKQICATGGGQHLFSSTCNGDSGGPLFDGCYEGSPVQIGITSYGPPICIEVPLNISFSVFTRVSAFSDWIKNKTENTVSIA